MQNINRWCSDQFQPPFYLESGQFDRLWVHSMNVVMSLDGQYQEHCFNRKLSYVFHRCRLVLMQAYETRFSKDFTPICQSWVNEIAAQLLNEVATKALWSLWVVIFKQAKKSLLLLSKPSLKIGSVNKAYLFWYW